MATPSQAAHLRFAAQRLAVEAQTALLSRRQQILQGDKRCQEYQSTIAMLQDLSQKGTADVMVPLGKAAFFPGRLIDPQQCLVKMGEDMHVHRTTKEAVAILKGRCKSIETKRTVLDEQIEALEKKLAIAQATLAVSLEEGSDGTEGTFDIREDYDEELHGPTTTPIAESAPSAASSAADNRTVDNYAGDSRAAASSTASSPGQQQAGGQPLRRKSVSFADEAQSSAAAPAQPALPQRGMKKGFFDLPKPALKKTAVPGKDTQAALAGAEELQPLDAASQRRIDEGRDAAFSGMVVERKPGAAQDTSETADSGFQGWRLDGHQSSPDGAAGQGPDHGGASQAPVKKVSRFKQQRAGS